MSKSSAKQVTKSGGQDVQTVSGQAVSPFEEMERLFDTFMGQPWPGRFMRPFEVGWGNLPAPFEGRSPKVDVINRDKEVLVRAELPGVKKEDLEVSVADDSVTLRAATRYQEEKEEGEYYRRETSSGEYIRTLALPAEVDGAKARAAFKDGVLELTLPKVAVSKRHKVPIA